MDFKPIINRTTNIMYSTLKNYANYHFLKLLAKYNKQPTFEDQLFLISMAIHIHENSEKTLDYIFLREDEILGYHFFDNEYQDLAIINGERITKIDNNFPGKITIDNKFPDETFNDFKINGDHYKENDLEIFDEIITRFKISGIGNFEERQSIQIKENSNKMKKNESYVPIQLKYVRGGY